MRVCTLIVRLFGLVLAIKSGLTLIELQYNFGPFNALFSESVRNFPASQMAGMVWRMTIYCALGVATGLTMAIFAPLLARALTFDERDKS